MRINKLLSVAVLMAASGTGAIAGGLNSVAMDAPLVAPIQTVAPQGSSVSNTFVVVGVLAALLVAAAVNADDE